LDVLLAYFAEIFAGNVEFIFNVIHNDFFRGIISYSFVVLINNIFEKIREKVTDL